MLRMILQLLRPSYALTALVLFGTWQGYSFVKSIPEKLHLPAVIEKVQKPVEPQEQSQIATTEQLPGSQQVTSIPIIAAIGRIHPGMRILYWLAIYLLLCFATVPLIKRMLACESNLVNVILIFIYTVLGVLLAFVFVAFQFTWITEVILGSAFIFSAAVIIKLASELEKMRVQDIFNPS